jgi:hypothetical protein
MEIFLVSSAARRPSLCCHPAPAIDFPRPSGRPLAFWPAAALGVLDPAGRAATKQRPGSAAGSILEQAAAMNSVHANHMLHSDWYGLFSYAMEFFIGR